MLTGIHVLLTLKCTNECDHCFLHCGPSREATFTIEQLRSLIGQIKQLGTVTIVYFEGGEKTATGECDMGASEPTTLSRACEVIEIPSGIRGTLPAGAVVRIMQPLGSSYTVATDRGYMYRIDARDTDALGLTNEVPKQASAVQEGIFSEQMVWDQLRTVYDPEIPVNIVDLGLVYSCVIAPLEQGGNRVISRCP